MAIREIAVQRFSTTSQRDFHDVVADLQQVIGRPDIAELESDLAAAKSPAELEGTVRAAAGSSGFIEFARFDLGAVVRKYDDARSPRILRILLGNPLLMAQMARHVPDAGSYAPVTVLIDARPDGVHLSYDRMASLLAPYGSPEALEVARELDAKVESLLKDLATDRILSGKVA